MECLVLVISLLFSCILRSAVYPAQWGIELIFALMKPGKPPYLVTSMRGIRLLGRASAWLSQVLDRRMRGEWQAGPEQFGFKRGVGCMEAVARLVYRCAPSSARCRAFCLGRTLAWQLLCCFQPGPGCRGVLVTSQSVPHAVDDAVAREQCPECR